MIGNTISHYKILEKLGEGGMGVVYKAEDTKLERTVAIKFLPQHIAAREDERERFKVEAKAAAGLNHPNIATIYSIEEVEDEMFIVMEYLEGVTLKDKVEECPLKIDEAIDIATQIAEGLYEAHQKGVVHRDIKSSNIMLAPKGQVKIMDFGLAKREGQLKLTKTGTTVGTTYYMSPEQVRGEDVDRRTDLWALGVVLYEMITGQLPFQGEYEHAVTYSILNVEHESLAGVRSGVPSELEGIVNRCLEKKREDRYQSTEHLVSDLKRLERNVQSGKSQSVTTSAITQGKPKKKKRLAIIGAVSLLLVAVISYLTIYLTSKEIPVEENTVAIMYIENQTGDETYTKQANTIIPLIYSTLFSSEEDIQLPAIEVRNQIETIQNAALIDKKAVVKILDEVGIKYRVSAIMQKTENGIQFILETGKPGKHPLVWQETLTKPNSVAIEEFAQKLAEWIEACVWVDYFEKYLHSEWNFPKNLTTRFIFKNKLSTNVNATKAFYQGYDLYQKWELRNSIPYFSEALERDPEYIIAAIHHASAYWETGQFQKGLNLFEQIEKEIDTFNPYEKLFFQSWYEFYNMAPDKGVKKFRELMEIEAYPDLWFYDIGNIYSQLNDFQNAVEMLEQHIKSGLNPQWESGYKVLQMNYNRMNLWNKGIKALKVGLKRNPDSRVLMDFIISQYLMLGKIKKADKWFARYEKLSRIEREDTAQGYISYGDHFLIMGDFLTANKYYQEVLSRRNLGPTLSSIIASKYVLMRNFDKAEEILVDARVKDPDIASINNDLAFLYIERPDYNYSTARQFAEKGKLIDNTVLLLSSALYFYELNEDNQAEANWNLLIEKYIELIETHLPNQRHFWNLGIYCAFKGELELAMEHLETAFKKGYREYPSLLYYPALDKLRDDPRTKDRYAKLIERVKTSYPALSK